MPRSSSCPRLTTQSCWSRSSPRPSIRVVTGMAQSMTSGSDKTGQPKTLSSPPPADQASVAAGALFREHHGDLVRLALLMVGDLPTAEDVVRDFYAGLQARWSHLAAPDAVPPYVRAAVLNGCRSVLRRRR